MSTEIPLQKDMFTDDLLDTRSRAQKSRDHESKQFRQISMFSARDTVQFGVGLRPWLKNVGQSTLELELQDERTEEQKEQERRRISEALTVPLFAADESAADAGKTDAAQPETIPEHVVNMVYLAPNLRQIGFRAYARRKSVPVRWRGEHTARTAA